MDRWEMVGWLDRDHVVSIGDNCQQSPWPWVGHWWPKWGNTQWSVCGPIMYVSLWYLLHIVTQSCLILFLLRISLERDWSQFLLPPPQVLVDNLIWIVSCKSYPMECYSLIGLCIILRPISAAIKNPNVRNLGGLFDVACDAQRQFMCEISAESGPVYRSKIS